ncbi:hypothetical protein BKA93DRAFT_780253 [Sparassis latifolia]
MSKSSTASAPKIPTQLPSKSAWSRGPPQTTATSRSQSPAPNASSPAPSVTNPSHSRRPSTLGQGVSFKDGVAGARTPTNTAKSGSSVTFGSIDDAAAPISSSPAAVPAIKSEGVKTFGSVPAVSSPVPNGKPSTSSPSSSASSRPASSGHAPKTLDKVDVKKLFQGSGGGALQSPVDVTSPSHRSSPLPQPSPQPSHSHIHPHPHPPHQSPPSQLGHGYTPFVPRPPQNGVPSAVGAPRSPVYPRSMPNGNVNGRPNGAPGMPGTPVPMAAGLPSAGLPSAGMPSAGMSSPRMGPPGQMAPPPMQVSQWGYYYPYPTMPPDYMPYPPQWIPQPMPPQHQHHPVQGGPSPHGAMPISPRNPPPPLHGPGTPTLTPAIPTTSHAPHAGASPSPHTHTTSLNSVSSPPPTPSTASRSGPTLNTNASAFVPRKGNVISLKTPTGMELDFESFKKQGVLPSPTVPTSPAKKVVRMETPEAKEKRLAEERARMEADEKAKRDKEEQEEKQREEELRKKLEVERQRREEEEKELARKEEEERARKEEEEEKKRAKEESERVKKEENERAKKKEEDRIRREEEEKERAKKEEEERAVREAEEKAKQAEASVEQPSAEAEDGEVEEKEETKEETRESEELDEATQEEAKDKVLNKNILRIDTAVPNPEIPRKRPGPLDLSSTRSQSIPQPLPSALATARVIEDLGTIAYPEGIKSPKVELNVNAKHGKFRYDREFLMQFMAICKEKPDSLPPLNTIGLESVEQSFPMSRGGSGRRSSSASMPPPPSTSTRQASVGLGISGFKPGSGGFNMGQFSTKMTSDERFAMSSTRSTSMSGTSGMPFGRPSPMVRTSSQGGPGGVPMGNNRTRSKRGDKRPDANKMAGSSSHGSSYASSMAMQAGMSLEPVAPLEATAGRWQASSVSKKPQQETDSVDVVDRKVRGLLNKLTMERFDSISDQIIAWANRSEMEKDGRTLIQVIRLVFEKATDEATWSEMYARLCRKMMEQISSKVQDEGIKTNEGKPIAGGQLFRKYLLNRCQEDFERGWVAKETTAAAAATKATEDQAAKAAAEKNNTTDDSDLYSEEYYAAQKAKRQGLGLIKFIGELFKLQMLTERIMHECVKKLLGNVENPEEEEIESLCKLLSTVGQILDTAKARQHMDVYFSRMKELCKSPNVNSRMQFMLQDVIELRERKWIPRNAVAAPSTIAAVHEAAAKEKAHDKDYQRLSMSRGGSRRGGERGDHTSVGPDGWAVAGGNVPRPPPKAGDLSNFGKISKAQPMTFGPSSVFTKEKPKSRESTMSRAGSSNMFSMLSGNPELAAEVAATSKSSRPPSRKPSVDLGTSGVPEAPMQRKRLNLLPRTLPKPDEGRAESTPAASEAGSEDEGAETHTPSMSEQEANARIKEDSKEFFSVRDLGEAEVYFTKLPSEHRWRLVDKLVSLAIESKESDAQLVAGLFSRAVAKNLCSPNSFEEGFMPAAEILDDIAIDAPKAFDLMAAMMKGAHLHEDEERRTRLASKSTQSDKLLALLS